ncbi:hypothetical protein EV175_003773 [Coemansia sp. RSA 1933]|nr:hypothetical protein EV175_003773 [Coemansia sp. RSA 1933]
MSDFTEGNRTAAPQEGNPFRPYADPLGGTHNDDLYEELKNPVGSIRGLSRIGENSLDPYRLNGTEGGAVSGSDVFDSLGLDYQGPVDAVQTAKDLFRYAGLRYLSALASSPFNIAQTLLQVQYLPAAVQGPIPADEGRDILEEAGDMLNPNDLEYYEYLRMRHTNHGTQPRTSERAHVDHDGYVVNTHEKGGGSLKPGYQLAALPEDKLTVIRTLLKHPTEGFFSLFKGCFTQWLYDILYLLAQPSLEVLLNEMLGVYESAPLYTYIDAAAPSALTVVASSLLVGWMLSPLELVRTRLMVQSSSPIHRKYHGTYHGLKTIAKEEGGIWSMYFNPYNMVPTVISHTLNPIFRNMGTFVLDQVSGIDPYDHPTTFAFGHLLWKTIAATVMLPIDTVRTRLQAQPRYTKREPPAGSARASTASSVKSAAKSPFKEFRTCVPLSPVQYTGMVNCAWRIITEEGESLKKMKKRQTAAALAKGNTGDGAQTTGVAHYGLRGLYPGLTLQLGANIAIFGLNFISTDEADFA